MLVSLIRRFNPVVDTQLCWISSPTAAWTCHQPQPLLLVQACHDYVGGIYLEDQQNRFESDPKYLAAAGNSAVLISGLLVLTPALET